MDDLGLIVIALVSGALVAMVTIDAAGRGSQLRRDRARWAAHEAVGPMAGPALRPRSAGAHVRIPHARPVEPITRAELVAFVLTAFAFGLSVGAFLWAP